MVGSRKVKKFWVISEAKIWKSRMALKAPPFEKIAIFKKFQKYSKSGFYANKTIRSLLSVLRSNSELKTVLLRSQTFVEQNIKENSQFKNDVNSIIFNFQIKFMANA